jgi:hypothetical protein
MPKASMNIDILTNIQFIYRSIYQESKPFDRLIFRQVLQFIKEAATPGARGGGRSGAWLDLTSAKPVWAAAC